MINEIFEQIKKEARLGKVTLKDGEISYSVSVLFNIVDDKILPGMPNIYIKDKSNFNNSLYTYVKTVLKFYNLEPNYENIKKILLYSVVNISHKR